MIELLQGGHYLLDTDKIVCEDELSGKLGIAPDSEKYKKNTCSENVFVL